MPSKNALNVSLTEQLCAFVDQQVASGRFRTASEVVRAALRALEREIDATGGGRKPKALSRSDAREPSKPGGSNFAHSL